MRDSEDFVLTGGNYDVTDFAVSDEEDGRDDKSESSRKYNVDGVNLYTGQDIAEILRYSYEILIGAVR